MCDLLMQTDPALGLPPWLAFTAPIRILEASYREEVLPCLREAEAELQRGRWVAGFVSYEAAPAFDRALVTHERGNLPLAWFGVFDRARPASPPEPPMQQPDLALDPALGPADYAARIAEIKAAIARGETYQVNFTFPLRGKISATSGTVFAALHHAQRGGYSTLIRNSAFHICSASPELFFRQDGDDITCRPMKGTAARGASWAEDESCGAGLRESAKDRAENVMIVDMIRNDLGRLAPAGGVRTQGLFEVQRLPTLWQMTSTVRARSTAGLPEIFSALFPCASITGAPKVKTAEWIRQLEVGPRGIYTGAIGFAGPGRKAQFNVAIRTLVMDPASQAATYGVGSGVVWDSEADREYQECLSKALILREQPEPFQLLSTLAWRPETGYLLLDRHLNRLERAARYFGFSHDRSVWMSSLRENVPAFAGQPRRVRVLIDPSGALSLEHAPLPPPLQRPWRVACARQPVDRQDPFLYFKTTRRQVYETARAGFPDVDDVILWNDQGQITESCIANLAILRDGRWITPPISCGLLDGIMREELLAQGILHEGVIHRDDLAGAEGLALLNSVRGWIPARLARRLHRGGTENAERIRP